MTKYRISRNIEASIIEFLDQKLQEANWTNYKIEKSAARVYGLQMDENIGQFAICVRASDANRKRVEIGNDATIRSQLILIDVFATSDGQRLDLVDFLIGVLLKGLPYYEYQVDKDKKMTQIQNGRLRVLTIDDKPINLNVDKSMLEVQDRFRHLLSATISLGRIEC